jgi:hypothetical protein
METREPIKIPRHPKNKNSESETDSEKKNSKISLSTWGVF